MLLGWKNERDTRMNSIVTHDKILLKNHLKWLEKTLTSKSHFLFIALYDGKPVGDVRFDRLRNGDFEISIRMDKKYRGKGLATKVISLAELFMFDPTCLVAKIVAHNINSMRVFISNGYKPEKFVDNTYYIFRKQ